MSLVFKDAQVIAQWQFNVKIKSDVLSFYIRMHNVVLIDTYWLFSNKSLLIKRFQN